jgi:HlyD family secretion protein
MKQRILIIIVVLLMVIGAAYYFYNLPAVNGTVGIETSGHVEVTDVEMSFRMAGHVDRLFVDEGDRVEKTQLLARLDQGILRDRVKQAEAQVRELEIREDALRLSIDIQEGVLEAEKERAAAAVSAAAARVQTLKTGSREQEIAEAAAARDRARSEMLNYRKNHERMKNLFERGIVPASRYDDARTALSTAQAVYEAALERYKLVKEGFRAEAISEGEANLTGSDAVLKAARIAVKETERLRLELQALEAKTDQSRVALDMAKDDWVKSSLTAPFDGFVTVKTVEEGEFVQVGSPVLTVARLDEVWVRTYIPETQLGRVRLGQSALVRSDSFPHKKYEGTVTYISPEAEFTPKNVQTREERVKLVFRIKVTLDNPNQELKPGMPVDVVLSGS